MVLFRRLTYEKLTIEDIRKYPKNSSVNDKHLTGHCKDHNGYKIDNSSYHEARTVNFKNMLPSAVAWDVYRSKFGKTNMIQYDNINLGINSSFSKVKPNI